MCRLGDDGAYQSSICELTFSSCIWLAFHVVVTSMQQSESAVNAISIAAQFQKYPSP
jgi:hypothetical protein